LLFDPISNNHEKEEEEGVVDNLSSGEESKNNVTINSFEKKNIFSFAGINTDSTLLIKTSFIINAILSAARVIFKKLEIINFK